MQNETATPVEVVVPCSLGHLSQALSFLGMEWWSDNRGTLHAHRPSDSHSVLIIADGCSKKISGPASQVSIIQAVLGFMEPEAVC